MDENPLCSGDEDEDGGGPSENLRSQILGLYSAAEATLSSELPSWSQEAMLRPGSSTSRSHPPSIEANVSQSFQLPYDRQEPTCGKDSRAPFRPLPTIPEEDSLQGTSSSSQFPYQSYPPLQSDFMPDSEPSMVSSMPNPQETMSVADSVVPIPPPPPYQAYGSFQGTSSSSQFPVQSYLPQQSNFMPFYEPSMVSSMPNQWRPMYGSLQGMTSSSQFPVQSFPPLQSNFTPYYEPSTVSSKPNQARPMYGSFQGTSSSSSQFPFQSYPTQQSNFMPHYQPSTVSSMLNQARPMYGSSQGTSSSSQFPVLSYPPQQSIYQYPYWNSSMTQYPVPHSSSLANPSSLYGIQTWFSRPQNQNFSSVSLPMNIGPQRPNQYTSIQNSRSKRAPEISNPSQVVPTADCRPRGSNPNPSSSSFPERHLQKIRKGNDDSDEDVSKSTRKETERRK